MYLIMVDDLFNVFLDLVCKYFIEYFYMYVHMGNWHVILFVESLYDLSISVTVAEVGTETVRGNYKYIA